LGAREQAEREVIEAALKKNNRNVAAAAREFKVTRETLYQKMKKYRLRSDCPINLTLSGRPGQTRCQSILTYFPVARPVPKGLVCSN
jgi:hypothetical protein